MGLCCSKFKCCACCQRCCSCCPCSCCKPLDEDKTKEFTDISKTNPAFEPTEEPNGIASGHGTKRQEKPLPGKCFDYSFYILC